MQTRKECRSPIDSATFDTLSAKIGRFFLFHNQGLNFPLKQNGLKRDIPRNFIKTYSGLHNRPTFASYVQKEAL